MKKTVFLTMTAIFACLNMVKQTQSVVSKEMSLSHLQNILILFGVIVFLILLLIM